MKHKFVEFMPDELQEGVIYISTEYGSVIHLCACGCGEEVNTPLSPTGWKLTFNGENIDLDPSIGNWNFSCRSHYWIKNNKVDWAANWSETQINYKRERDRRESESYYSSLNSKITEPETKVSDTNRELSNENLKPFWVRFFNWIGF